MTAAERAAEVIYAMLDDEHAVVACLMADPALLADLAIEAGGLVALSDTFAWKPDPDFAGAAIVNIDGPNRRGGDGWQPLYRRTTEQEAT